MDLSRDASDASDDENVSRVGDVRGLAPPPCALGEGATMLQLQAAGAGASRSSRGEPGVEPPRSGAVLDAKYRLIDPLAAGTMGSVWRAEHLALEVPVAIKFMNSSAATDADVSRRFLLEARIASALGSPHVPQVLDFGVDRGRPYMVMELLRGESLAQRLRRLGRLSPRQTAGVLVPLAQTLQRVHDLGVVHRDLKPENVFIVHEAERELPKLLDFGVAKVQKDKNLSDRFEVNVSRDTAEGEMVGTPHYMSPEQARGSTSVDHRSDVWALGVMAFECLLGYPPFVASGLGNLLLQICAHPLPRPSAFGVVPVGFDAWFARACARPADARFSTVNEAAVQLQRLCEDGRLEGPRRPASSIRERAPWRWLARWMRRDTSALVDRTRRRWLAAIALISLLCMAAVGGNLVRSRASRSASWGLDTEAGTALSAAPAGARRPSKSR